MCPGTKKYLGIGAPGGQDTGARSGRGEKSGPQQLTTLTQSQLCFGQAPFIWTQVSGLQAQGSAPVPCTIPSLVGGGKGLQAGIK